MSRSRKGYHFRSIDRRWRKELSAASRRVLVFSPYLTSRTAELVLECTSPSTCEIHTILSLEAFAAGASSIRTLKHLLNRGFPVFEIPGLHAKVIIVEDTFASVGSQNLTSKGVTNREASVAVTRPADIFAIIELTKPWLATRTEVTKEILEDFERRIPDAAKAFRKARRQAAEIESDVREAAKRRVRKATRIVRKIRQSTPWLRRTETIPRDVAERFVKRSAWWLTHSSGEPVRAPGHADRLRMSGHGSAVKFGANTFLVGKAIERCRNDLNDFFDEAAKGKRVELAVVREALKRHISRAVANYNGDEYAGPYPISNDQLVFGAQAIDVNDGATFILDEARASELFV